MRRPLPEDAASVAAVYVDSWNAGFARLMPPRVLDAGQVGRWNRDLHGASMQWWIAATDRGVVGFAGTGPSRDPKVEGLGELDTIAVVPSAWRLGIGRQLMDASHADLLAAGYEDAIVWTLLGYDRGSAFYEAMGWHLSGEQRDAGRQIAFRRSVMHKERNRT